MIYPRFLVRTSRRAAVLIALLFALMVLLILTAAATRVRPLPRLILPLACALMATGLGRRALNELQQLEQSRSQPDALMLTLFDLAYGVPTLALIAIVAMLAP